MSLKISWISIPLLKNIIKRNILLVKISLITFGGFCLLSWETSLYILPILVFGVSAVLLTTFYAGYIQKYMTNQTEAAFISTLPLEKITMWFTHYLAGLLLILVPLLIEGIVVDYFIGIQMFFMDEQYSVLIPTILLTLIYYNISYFTVFLCGTRISQIIFSIAIICTPLFFCLGIMMLLGDLYPSMDFGSINFKMFYAIVPFISGIRFLNDGVWPFLTTHIIIMVMFFIASYFVYQNRACEKTGQFSVYKVVNYVVKIYLVITISLILFACVVGLLDVVKNYSFSTIIYMGAIFVSITIPVAILTEMIFKNSQLYKSLGYYIVISLICFSGCYLFGNSLYNNLITEMVKSETVELIIDEEIIIELDSKDVEEILNDFNNNKDKLIKSNLFDVNNGSSVQFYGYTYGSNRQFPAISYLVDTDYLNKYIEENDELSKKVNEAIGRYSYE